MAFVYRCKSCSLGFELGWDHFHWVIRGATASTGLVCRGCGAWYSLEHKIDGTPDALYWFGGPVSTESGVPLTPLPGTPEHQPVATDHRFRPVRARHGRTFLEGLHDSLALEGFSCPHCNRPSLLTATWPEGDPTCPRCREPSLALLAISMT